MSTFETDLTAALATTSGTVTDSAGNTISVKRFDWDLFFATLIALGAGVDDINAGTVAELASRVTIPDSAGDEADFQIFADANKLKFLTDLVAGVGTTDVLELDKANSLGRLFGSLMLTVGNLAAQRAAAANVVQTNYSNAKAFSSGTDVHISDLDVTITPSHVNARILLLGYVAHVSSPDGVFYLKRNAVEFGSAASAGSRTVGFAPLGYQGTTVTTSMTAMPIIYVDQPGSIAAQTYTLHARYPSSTVFYLNRGSADSDSGSNERATSRMIALEV